MSLIKDAWKLAFQISPIVLVDGLATGMPGSMLPIVVFTEAVNFTKGLLSGADVLDLDNFFAHFRPAPGASLISYEVGEYPFANQGVAANALIKRPLAVSMLMSCPAKGTLGYPAKLATMMALRASLDQHANLGGTYIVATPSYIYTSCLLLDMRHVSDQDSNQSQVTWQLDFKAPLLTEEQAQSAQNSLMSKISSGVQTDTGWSGGSQTIGFQPSLATAAIVPAAAATAAAGVPTAPRIPTSLPGAAQ